MDQETGQRGFLLTGKEEFLAPFEAGKRSASMHFQELKDLSQKSFEQAAMISQLDAVVSKSEQ